jgi:hypothetical protein
VQGCGSLTALLGLIVFIALVVMIHSGRADRSGFVPALAILAMFLGSVCVLIGRIGALWHLAD